MNRAHAVALIGALAAAGAPTAFVPPRVIAALESPDGRTAIELRRAQTSGDKDGPLVYHVTRNGQDVLADSPLGIRRADQAFDAAALTLIGAGDVRAID